MQFNNITFTYYTARKRPKEKAIHLIGASLSEPHSSLVVCRDTVHSTSALFLSDVHFYKAEQPLLLVHAVIYPELYTTTDNS